MSATQIRWLSCSALVLLAAGCSGNGSGATSSPADRSAAGNASPVEEKPPFQPDKPEAIHSLKRLGVSLGYDQAGRVISADFGAKATNPWLAHRRAAQRRRLDLCNTNITDAGLVNVQDSTTHHTALPDISDDGLVNLKDSKFLEELYLDNTKVTSAGLSNLKDAQHLRVLALTGTKVADDGLSHLAGLQRLEWLNLSSTLVTDQGLARLQSIPKLKTLNLFLLNGVTDAGISNLSGMKSLVEIDLGFTSVTNAGVDRLKIALPNAKISH